MISSCAEQCLHQQVRAMSMLRRLNPSRMRCRVQGQRKAHRKALGWAFLDVEASQVPVQFCASNRYCSSPRIECSSATSASAASSSSGGRWHFSLTEQMNSRTSEKLQVSIVLDMAESCQRLLSMESEIIWSQLEPRPAGGAPLANLTFTTPLTLTDVNSFLLYIKRLGYPATIIP